MTTQVRGGVFKDGHLSIPAGSEVLREFERLIFAATKIRLLINPLDHEHQKLVDAVGNLMALFRTAAPGDDIQDNARTELKSSPR